MPYRLLPDLTRADAAFEVWADSFESLVCEASRALLEVMLDDPAKLRGTVSRDVVVTAPDAALLLYRALEELLFLRDAEGLLMRYARASRTASGEDEIGLRLEAVGEPLDAFRGEFRAEVKAVTFHRLSVQRRAQGDWRATVVVDV